ncbi:hypothetical protein C8Q73DRAFT_503430 [Cubamyces lactineus]|nr:hypothetical protein C8Q73DRAFT_503430 [Cubamyces lactineus]
MKATTSTPHVRRPTLTGRGDVGNRRQAASQHRTSDEAHHNSRTTSRPDPRPGPERRTLNFAPHALNPGPQAPSLYRRPRSHRAAQPSEVHNHPYIVHQRTAPPADFLPIDRRRSSGRRRAKSDYEHAKQQAAASLVSLSIASRVRVSSAAAARPRPGSPGELVPEVPRKICTTSCAVSRP